MSEVLAMIERQQLQDLLGRWQRGEIDERDVHEEAERLWDCYVDDKEYSEGEFESIAMDILINLDSLDRQLVTPEDIPAMRTFLATPLGQEYEGWQLWERYWAGVDFEQRRQSLLGNMYYSRAPTTAERKRRCQ